MVAGSVATVVVGDGRRRNALDTAGWDALRHSVAGLPNELQAVVVHGAGATFCAGSDLREWDGAEPAVVDASFAAMEAALRAVEAVPVPTLAVVRARRRGRAACSRSPATPSSWPARRWSGCRWCGWASCSAPRSPPG